MSNNYEAFLFLKLNKNYLALKSLLTKLTKGYIFNLLVTLTIVLIKYWEVFTLWVKYQKALYISLVR